MADKIKTKHGLIRERLDGTFTGYVNLGTDYLMLKEDEILMNYVDLGYIIQDNDYIMQGGSVTEYIYKYKDIDGMVYEENIEHVQPPTMLMRTSLIKLEG
tara:strand:+ start:29 stop:328 length:300 start_codon:yes stop_codon:yes gene_type:complete